MIRREKLIDNVKEIDIEIHRRCIAIGLNCKDEVALQSLAREVLWNTSALHKAASGGNIPARIKVELYALTMMVHGINKATLGPFYLVEIEEVFSLKTSWAAIAQAIWKELDRKGLDKES